MERSWEISEPLSFFRQIGQSQMNGGAFGEMARHEAVNFVDASRVEAGVRENDNGWRERISREQPQNRPRGSRLSAQADKPIQSIFDQEGLDHLGGKRRVLSHPFQRRGIVKPTPPPGRAGRRCSVPNVASQAQAANLLSPSQTFNEPLSVKCLCTRTTKSETLTPLKREGRNTPRSDVESFAFD